MTEHGWISIAGDSAEPLPAANAATAQAIAEQFGAARAARV